jgi:hypothetical protein
LILAGRHHLQLAIVANGCGTIFVAGSLKGPVPTALTRTHCLLPQETKLFLFDHLRRDLGVFDLKQGIFTSVLAQSNIFLTQSDIFQHCSDILLGREIFEKVRKNILPVRKIILLGSKIVCLGMEIFLITRKNLSLGRKIHGKGRKNIFPGRKSFNHPRNWSDPHPCATSGVCRDLISVLPHLFPLPKERTLQCMASDLRKIVRSIQPHHISKMQGAFLLLLGGEGRDEGGR